MKISFLFAFTDKSSFGVEFNPDNVLQAKEQLKGTIDYQNSLLDDPRVTTHLTKKSNVRAKRKALVQILFNGNEVKTGVKLELKTSAFENSDFLDGLFEKTVLAAQNIINSNQLGIELRKIAAIKPMELAPAN